MTARNLADTMTAIGRALADLRQHINDHPTRALIPDDEREQLAGRVAELAAQLAGGEYRPAYNGWPNRETWNAHLWISNDPGPYEIARELVADAMAHYVAPVGISAQPDAEQRAKDERRGALRDAGDALRDWFDEAYRPGAPYEEEPASPLVDAWHYAVACVDWRRVAEAIAE